MGCTWNRVTPSTVQIDKAVMSCTNLLHTYDTILRSKYIPQNERLGVDVECIKEHVECPKSDLEHILNA